MPKFRESAGTKLIIIIIINQQKIVVKTITTLLLNFGVARGRVHIMGCEGKSHINIMPYCMRHDTTFALATFDMCRI